MTTNPTLAAGELSTEIIKEGFRAELQQYADDGTTPLEDPREPRGDKTPPFVLTSYPSSTPVYPHIIVQEGSDDAGPIDQRQSAFYQHDFSVQITVEARASTEKFDLKAGVRAFLQDREQALRDRGFAELDYSTSNATWDATSETASWQVAVSGLVHTTTDT